MTREHLDAFTAAGWRLTRDGSTATAHFAWDDPDDSDSGWEVLVLHTTGHRPRFTLNAFESGLTERSPEEASALAAALAQARELLAHWAGELPGEI